MSSHRHERWMGDLSRKMGIGGNVDFTQARVGQTLHVPCERGHKVDVHLPSRMPPEAVCKKMLRDGWSMGTHLLCPKHAKPKRKFTPAEVPQKEEIEMPPASNPPHPVELPAPAVLVKTATPAAGKAKRMVYMALEDYYDEATKRYKAGHSDATIAKTVNLSEKAVREIREESFGPLGEPAELGDLREACKTMRETVNTGVAELRQAIHALELKIDRIAEKNGWK